MRAHGAGAVQRPRRRSRPPSARTAPRSPASSSSRSRATWAACRRARGFLEGLRELCDRSRRAADLRRGDDGLPRRVGRRAGASTASGPTSPASARWWAAGSRRRPTAGARELMAEIAPAGPVYQAGTLSGNPLAMAAGLETLRRLARRGVYEALGRDDAGSSPRASPSAPPRPASSSRPPPSAACSASSSTPARCAASRTRRSRTARASGRFFAADARRAASTWRPRAYEAGFVSLAHGAAGAPRSTLRARRGGARGRRLASIEGRGASGYRPRRFGPGGRERELTQQDDKGEHGRVRAARRQGLSGGAGSGLRDPDRRRARLLGRLRASERSPSSCSSAWGSDSPPSSCGSCACAGWWKSRAERRERDEQ